MKVEGERADGIRERDVKNPNDNHPIYNRTH